MYAVIQTGGKQYRVTQGDLISVEKLSGEVGESVDFDEVLFVSKAESSETGAAVSDARVVGTIVKQGKGPKTLVFKFKRRKMYRKLVGHRQNQTGIRIDEIVVGGAKAQAVAAEEPVEKPRPKKAEAKAKPKAKVKAKPKAETKAAPAEDKE